MKILLGIAALAWLKIRLRGSAKIVILFLIIKMKSFNWLSLEFYKSQQRQPLKNKLQIQNLN